MDALIIASITALWLGILTSISPCPLATNIAAIAYIGKSSQDSKLVLLSGLLYTLGRMLSYFVVAMLIIESLEMVPAVSNFLQNNMNRILGPILIIVGMILVGLLSLPSSNGGISEGVQKLVSKSGILGAFLLGVIFSLSFCPVSAALYFGSLIPLATAQQSAILLPSIYGVGTAVPVIVFAFVIAFSANLLGKYFNTISKIEQHARMITGVLFIVVGIYYILRFVFNLI